MQVKCPCGYKFETNQKSGTGIQCPDCKAIFFAYEEETRSKFEKVTVNSNIENSHNKTTNKLSEANLNKQQNERINCPYCDEDISSKAIKCKHCGEFLNSNLKDIPETNDFKKSKFNWLYLTLAIVINIIFFISIKNSGIYELKDYNFGTAITCIPFSYFAAIIANYLRKVLMPDFIITDEGFTGLLKAQIFWLIGPQIFASIVPPVIAAVIISL